MHTNHTACNEGNQFVFERIHIWHRFQNNVVPRSSLFAIGSCANNNETALILMKLHSELRYMTLTFSWIFLSLLIKLGVHTHTHVLVHCEGFYMCPVIKTIKQIVRWYINFDKYYAFRRIWSQSTAWLTYICMEYWWTNLKSLLWSLIELCAFFEILEDKK